MTLKQVVIESGRADDQPIFLQTGQAWNHMLYWNQFKGSPSALEGDMAACQRRSKSLPLGRNKTRPLGSSFSALSFAFVEPVAFSVHLQNIHVVREPV